MIHIPIIVAAAVWYYDPEIRKFVNKHARPHTDKLEGQVRKIYESTRARVVNKKTNDSQE